MKKKKMNEKKNLIRSSWMGYCPFSVLSHDTVDCIVTQARRGSLGQEGHGHDTALRHGEERPRHGQGRLRYGRPARKGKRRTPEGLDAEGLCCDKNWCIVTGMRLGHWVVSRYRHDTTGGSAAIRRRGARVTKTIRPPKPATRPGRAYDTAQCPCRLGRVCTWCSQPVLDSVHCSESLFGTLSMSTVHEHCSQNSKKNLLK